MEGKTNVVFYFYVLEKHYANCKRTTTTTRKITDVFQRKPEEKEEERSVENEKETENAVTSDNSNIVVEEAEQ